MQTETSDVINTRTKAFFKSAPMYIYEVQENMKVKFKEKVKIFWAASDGANEKLSLFSEVAPWKLKPGQLVYEIWNPLYLEQHPNSTSDLMLEAEITHDLT